MIQRETEHFNLAQICQSGQCFRMNKCGDGEGRYRVIAGRHYLEMKQRENVCLFFCEEEEFENFWKNYFDLETDYASWISQIHPDDAYLNQAAEFGSGIRILRQDFWEIIVSFLISQQNNIARIRRCIENICECYGEKCVSANGTHYYAFPKPEALAGLAEDALMACNLGYRSKYVVRAARSVTEGKFDMEAVCSMTYQEAREKLLQLFGVGEKVADCICLYSLHHLQAFPVDTHIRQALQNNYKRGFPVQNYEGYQGVMQQYIFYYELFGTVVPGGKK